MVQKTESIHRVPFTESGDVVGLYGECICGTLFHAPTPDTDHPDIGKLHTVIEEAACGHQQEMGEAGEDHTVTIFPIYALD